MERREIHFNVWYLIIAIVGVLWLREAWVTARQVQPIPYSQFQQQLKDGRIKEIAVSRDTIQGTYKEPTPDGRERFVTARVDPDLAKDLAQYDVKYTGAIENTFFHDILSWVLPALVFYLVWMFLVRRMSQQGGMGGLLSIGKSRAKVYIEADTKTTFADVAGVDEAKEELREVVGFLKDPARFNRLGGRIPKGVLLVGPCPFSV